MRGIIRFQYCFSFILFILDSTLGAEYSGKEKDALAKFRAIVGDALYQDFMKEDDYLIRWLRDANFNLDQAHSKFKKSLKWRKENGIDSILQEDFRDINRACPVVIDGHDRDFRPIVTMSVGQCDARRLAISGNIDKVYRNIFYTIEKAAQAVRSIRKTEEGKNVRDGVLIIDVGGFNLRQHGCLRCLPLLTTLLTTYESHYPEYIYRAHFINVPRAGETLLNLLRPFVSQKSGEITRFYGHDRAEWKAGLLKNISPDQLSIQYGGTRVSPRL